MTARRTLTPLTRALRWLRGPRHAATPAPDLSWLDRADGLDTRRADLHATLRAEGTRYDAQWPSVIAAETPGGDLAAMAAPWPGMARDALGVYAEPVAPDLFSRRVCPTCESPEPRLHPAVQFEGEVQPCADPFHYAEPVKPRGRHRQTDPLDLILADLRDLGGL